MCKVGRKDRWGGTPYSMCGQGQQEEEKILSGYVPYVSMSSFSQKWTKTDKHMYLDKN